MRTMNPEALRTLVRTLDLGPEPAAARGPATPLRAIPVSDGLIVGGNMLAFSENVAPPARDVVSLCLLYAQEAANADAAVYNPDLWVDRHDMILKGLGWTATGGATQFTRFEKSGVSVHKAVLPLLTAALGPAATAGALILTGLTQLQTIDKDQPWITLFDKESRRFEHSEYRFLTAEHQGDAILLRLAALRFTAVAERVQVLFFKKKDTEIEFTIATRTLAADPLFLDEIEPLLRDRLLSRASDLIKSIDLPAFT
jgi:hypothetical protein